MKLYNYFRSSASYRVRIALALKGLPYDYMPVHLQRNEQTGESYAQISASRLVPLLDDDGKLLTQSLAIIEYLDETHPQPPLLPAEPVARARVRALALDIACEIHPLNNLRVLRYLVHDLKVSEDDKNRWYKHWVETGLEAVERQIANHPQTGRFCHGDAPTLADCTLVPQVFNAQRFDCRLDHVPTVMRVFENCMALDAFAKTPALGLSRRGLSVRMREAPHPDWLVPDWGADGVGALMSTRRGGVGSGAFATLNLRDGLGDDPATVAANRARFARSLGGAPVLLNQVHGARVVRLGPDDARPNAPVYDADASITTVPGIACVVQVADCLPVLLAAPQGRGVGAAHAGWRGLAAGVVDHTVQALCEATGCARYQLKAWLGACIGPTLFEVGADVLQAFGADPNAGGDLARFRPHAQGKWMADLAGLARDRLQALGVRSVSGGRWCTAEDASRFFSFRRDRVTGRMAAAVWIERG